MVSEVQHIQNRSGLDICLAYRWKNTFNCYRPGLIGDALLVVFSVVFFVTGLVFYGQAATIRPVESPYGA